MPKITVQIEDADTRIIEQMLKALSKHPGAWDLSTEKKEDAACKIPSTDSTQNEAKRLAERQEYCICMINSAKKVLENLQLELSKESMFSGGLTRSIYRELDTVMEKYLSDSRKLLSKEVNSLPPDMQGDRWPETKATPATRFDPISQRWLPARDF